MRNGIPRRAALIALMTLLAGACSVSNLLGPPPAPEIYVLRPVLGDLTGPKVSWALAVDRPSAPTNIETDRIAISRSANTEDYYADASWTDRLPGLLQRELVQAFEKSARIDQVADDASAVHSDYILETEIRTFQARYAQPDGAPTAIVSIGARLISRDTHSIVAHVVVEKQAPATQNSINAAVEALDRASGDAISQIVTWALAAVRPSAGAEQEQTRRHKRSH